MCLFICGLHCNGPSHLLSAYSLQWKNTDVINSDLGRMIIEITYADPHTEQLTPSNTGSTDTKAIMHCTNQQFQAY